jgi:thiol-disulfide isomerase/thioredoxin
MLKVGRSPIEKLRKVISTAEELDAEMREAKEDDMLLILEVFSAWCGPCEAIMPTMKKLYLSPDYPIEIKYLSVDADATLKDLENTRENAGFTTGEAMTVMGIIDEISREDVLAQRWARLIDPWRRTVEPVFLILRQGHLVSVVEGCNAPQLEYAAHQNRQAEFDEEETTRVGLTQKEAHRYAFKIQTIWRRKIQLRRIGKYVDGVFYTHAELREKEQQEEMLRIQRTKIKELNMKATLIQMVWRGHVTRDQIEKNRKTLMARAKMAISRTRRKKDSIYNHSRLSPIMEAKSATLWKKFMGGKLTPDEAKIVSKKFRIV